MDGGVYTFGVRLLKTAGSTATNPLPHAKAAKTEAQRSIAANLELAVCLLGDSLTAIAEIRLR